ncbi:MAG: exopolysaccharide Pel transporter PelG [Elusimicrobiota bacterium]
MAGIGFRIEHILKDDSYTSTVKAHYYSTLISAGPWLLSVLTLFLLTMLAPARLGGSGIVFFRAGIIYIYAFSLVVVGAFYLSLSRYMADRIYIGDDRSLIPIYNSALLIVVVFQFCTGWLLVMSLGTAFMIKLLMVMIYVVVSGIWLAMIFLTALRDYKSISTAYIRGGVLTVILSVLLGRFFGLAGYFLGYLAGHMFIFISLSFRIMIEFDTQSLIEWGFWEYMLKNPALVMIGVIYNAAVWVDKFIMWHAEGSFAVAGVMKIHPFYDSTVFLAYLTMVPALSLFLIRVETDFYRKYSAYYHMVLNRGTFRDIAEAKGEMSRSLKNSINILIVYQGMFSLLMIILAEKLIPLVRMSITQVPLFRITVLGAFLHSLIFSGIIIMLYFDFRKPVLAVSLIFLVFNALFTKLSANAGFQYLGYGYFGAALITLLSLYILFNRNYRNLEYYTFALQPAAMHRKEEIV